MKEWFQTQLKKKTERPTFAEALLGDVQWGQANGPRDAGPMIKEELTERAIVLDSFSQFAKEKIETTHNPLSFPGWEITIKGPEEIKAFTPTSTNYEEWENRFEKNLVKPRNSELLVLFVTDVLRKEKEESELPLDLASCFSKEVGELFQKMIMAMKLTSDEFRMTAVKFHETRTHEDLLEEIYWLRPKIVITLGAAATQALLPRQDRLAQIHGRFFPLKEVHSDLQVVPVFHPSIMINNTNMKKTTWVDLQKVMKSLAKS